MGIWCFPTCPLASSKVTSTQPLGFLGLCFFLDLSGINIILTKFFTKEIPLFPLAKPLTSQLCHFRAQACYLTSLCLIFSLRSYSY